MDEAILKGCGWALGIGTAEHHGEAPSPDFHGIYDGEALGRPARGILAAVATSEGAWEAAQIAVNGFAEGYFGAADALPSSRAAARSLSSINGWLHSQSQQSAAGHEFLSSFSAVLLAGRRIDVMHVGACRIYACRDGDAHPVTPERSEAGGRARLLGADAAVHIDHVTGDVQRGDRLVLLSAGAAACLNSASAREVLATGGTPSDAAKQIETRLAGIAKTTAISVVVIDILELPRVAYEDIAARYAELPVRSPPQEGELLDGFRIGRTINRGRYTLLKRARDEANKCDVVLKFPLPSMLTDQVFRAGFLREAWVGTTIRSDCVARYIDLPPERQSCLYLVMPFYKGETLEQRLAHTPRVGLAEGCGVALKLCTAVTELGKHGVIHRDIKPENIMLVNDGNVLLLDLGLAYLTGIDDPEEDRLGGTTRYMAPELFSGTAPNARSEVFSLGVTTYRMFARGKFPFGQRERLPLSRLRPDLPAWLGEALKKSIASKPADRFADADAFGAAIQNGLVRGDLRPAGGGGLRVSSGLFWKLAALFFALCTLALVMMR